MAKESGKLTAKAGSVSPKRAGAGRYIEGVGRRKTAVARVRITVGGAAAEVNKRPLGNYFGLPILEKMALSPLRELNEKASVHAQVRGGGIHAQAEAVRLGLARALAKLNPENGPRLRTLGFLTRDPRMVERKKYGLKKARRAPQWAKR